MSADPVVLATHINALHKADRAPKAATLDQLVRWHRQEHHRFHTNHYHEGVNLGPGDRPQGWTTGEGARPR